MLGTDIWWHRVRPSASSSSRSPFLGRSSEHRRATQRRSLATNPLALKMKLKSTSTLVVMIIGLAVSLPHVRSESTNEQTTSNVTSNVTSTDLLSDPTSVITPAANLSSPLSSLVNESNSTSAADNNTITLTASLNGTLALLDMFKAPRRGRNMNFEFPGQSAGGGFWGPKLNTPTKQKFLAIQSRILTGGGPSPTTGEQSTNSFRGDRNNIRQMASGKIQSPTSGSFSNLKPTTSQSGQNPGFTGQPSGQAPASSTSFSSKFDAALMGSGSDHITISSPDNQPAPFFVKTQPPQGRYSSVSYAAPDGGVGGLEPSDLIPYYHDRNHKVGYQRDPVMYQLVPLARPTPAPYSFHDAVKETIFKVKDHVSGTVTKVKNALGFHGFSEKIASPDALMAVAPVAAGLLAGGLAAAYFASKSTKNVSLLPPFNFFGKRSVRDVVTEEDLNHIVARLDPVQREYLQKLQFYGPQRWKDVTCAKYIFCDVMSKATPIHVLDMQRKIGIFLSRMDETTARYVEVILKDVMLAIQARDCSRFSCAQPGWGGLPLHRPPPLHHAVSHNRPHIPLFPGHNFLRRQ